MALSFGSVISFTYLCSMENDYTKFKEDVFNYLPQDVLELA